MVRNAQACQNFVEMHSDYCKMNTTNILDRHHILTGKETENESPYYRRAITFCNQYSLVFNNADEHGHACNWSCKYQNQPNSLLHSSWQLTFAFICVDTQIDHFQIYEWRWRNTNIFKGHSWGESHLGAALMTLYQIKTKWRQVNLYNQRFSVSDASDNCFIYP